MAGKRREGWRKGAGKEGEVEVREGREKGGRMGRESDEVYE